jgi:acyl dehydratase
MTTAGLTMADLAQFVGREVGTSDWIEVGQDRIDRFADCTSDDQWIHVDVERAETESPFGTTIAHGNLTLSMIDGFRPALFEAQGFKLGVNYGWNKVRFPAPVRTGTRIRASIETVSVDEVGGGWHQAVQRWTIEAEGSEKPVCVADSVVRFLA